MIAPRRIKDNHLAAFAPLGKIYVLAVVLLSVLYRQAAAQDSDNLSGFGIEASFVTGKILKHSKKIIGPVPDHSYAAEVNFLQQTRGRKSWQARRGYPQTGVGITYTNYGLDSIYGQCISIYPNLQFNIIRGRALEWTFRAGFGIGYVTRRYERAGNALNTAIGSHVNNFTLLATDLRYRITPHLDAEAGLRFSHISNAALKQPNLGLNMWGAAAGIRYFPVTSRPEKRPSLGPLPKSRWGLGARFGFAYNESGYADGPFNLALLASVFAAKRWHGYNRVFAGVDYSYHKRIETFLKNNEIFPGEEAAHSWKSAVFAGNEFLFGRTGIILQVGVYIHDAALHLDPYYQKLGVHFYLIQRDKGVLKDLSVGILLKTHKAQAELAEAGIGIGF